MTSRVQGSWLAVRGTCLAFLHIIIMPTSPLLWSKISEYKRNGPLVLSAHHGRPWWWALKFSSVRKFHHQIDGLHYQPTQRSPIPHNCTC